MFEFVITDNGVKNVIDGDILPPPLTTSENKDGNDKRNALRDRRYIWRSREVPFYFDPELSKLKFMAHSSVI